ncbi:hypothetical protein D9613_005669 [Agrocybe pediades]|uniref:C2H2-type domain-containing protein n=1 Tax=Agrocybe pediades TaxID=84607 RepID=A0A8H4VR43_9AGAR|nr:hypothetical protein D9613_005669 [Agrocybe pediades]
MTAEKGYSALPSRPQPVSSSVPHRLGLLELRLQIPDRLFKQNTLLGASFLLRDLVLVVIFAYTVYRVDLAIDAFNISPTVAVLSRAVAWLSYWWFQGLVFTGIWIIGHEVLFFFTPDSMDANGVFVNSQCGHGSFVRSRLLSEAIGFICHTVLCTPYFSWKFTHQLHHRHHASMEKDQHWVPRSRSSIKSSSLEDAPAVSLLRLIVQQLLGFPAYLLLNASGQPGSDPLTSHLNPYASSLYKPSQRKHVMISDVALVCMAYALYLCGSRLGFWIIFRYYGIPYILVNHWVTMIVFLQHTDPQLPHFRKNAWTFYVGALSTMDYDFLGWQGRFFLHNIAHFHTIHHLFPAIPFYHAAEATEILKRLLPDNYRATSKPVFKCLWENFNKCQFVDDEGDILYYRDKRGQCHVSVEDILKDIPASAGRRDT